MNSIKKPLLAAGVIGTIGIGTLATGVAVYAQSGTDKTDPMSGLVDKLASTFNLDKTKVQEVFDQQRAEKDKEREAKVAGRLQTLVDKGTITGAQKTAIEAKLKEMKENRQENKDKFRDMTEEERKSSMEDRRDELESWADEQGINLSEIKGIFGGPGGPRGGNPPRE